VVKTGNGLNRQRIKRMERISMVRGKLTTSPFNPLHPLTNPLHPLTASKKGSIMLDRRKFLKIFGFTTLALSFLPGMFLSAGSKFGKNSTVSATTKNKSLNQTKNWLYGSSRKGCSTSRVAVDYHGSLEDGLDDFLNFRIPVEFGTEIPHGQYLS
jgi:hypothetical protein